MLGEAPQLLGSLTAFLMQAVVSVVSGLDIGPAPIGVAGQGQGAGRRCRGRRTGRGSWPAASCHAAEFSRSSSPPGPVDSWLGETLVHAKDIRRPLGIAHAYPVDALSRVAGFYRGSNLLIGAKNRVAGLTLGATDTEWTAGSGPQVAGPMLALVLATTGRAAALEDLTGEGVATPWQRIGPVVGR